MMRVSAGLCRDEKGRYLICKRGEGRHNAHLWEFPGGKQEVGEAPEVCLCRELVEELNLPVANPRVVCTAEKEGILFDFILCDVRGMPVLTEHEAMAFVHPREMLTLPFCPADTDIMRRLALNAPPLRHFFWDFDGTVMDTYPGMTAAFLRAAASFGVTAEAGRVLGLLKQNLGVCIATYATENRVSADMLEAAFRREEARVTPEQVRPVAGIPEVLQRLTDLGGKHYLVTHRDAVATRWLTWTGLRAQFCDIITADDGFPRKPCPNSLHALLTRHKLDKSTCVMIGDRPLDTAAGRNAGMLSCLLDTEGRFPDDPAELHVSCAGALGAMLCPEGLQV